MKYLDKIQYIRGGGTTRNGKAPDMLCDVIFIKKEDEDRFSFAYSETNKVIGYGKISSIVTVNGEPVQK